MGIKIKYFGGGGKVDFLSNRVCVPDLNVSFIQRSVRMRNHWIFLVAHVFFLQQNPDFFISRGGKTIGKFLPSILNTKEDSPMHITHFKTCKEKREKYQIFPQARRNFSTFSFSFFLAFLFDSLVECFQNKNICTSYSTAHCSLYGPRSCSVCTEELFRFEIIAFHASFERPASDENESLDASTFRLGAT